MADPKIATYVPPQPPHVVATVGQVLYVGLDNPIEVAAAGFTPDALAIKAEGATIEGSGGKFSVRPTTVGSYPIGVMARRTDGAWQEVGAVTLQSRRVPDPVAYVGNIKADGIMTKAEVANIRGIFAKMENFPLDVHFTIVSFVLAFVVNDQWIAYKSSGPSVTADMSKVLASAKVGTRFVFEQVNVSGPDGSVRKIAGVVLQVK